MEAVQFKLIDDVVHFRSLRLYEKGTTTVNSDGEDIYGEDYLVSDGYTEWIPFPVAKASQA
jgi:hypothetical protein